MVNMLGEWMRNIQDVASNDFCPVIDDHGSLKYVYEDSVD
jgi:hypothetical protein